MAVTCDTCRKRKIKCVNDENDPSRPCEGCVKLGIECKHDYVKQKPGRKNSFAPSQRGVKASSHTTAGNVLHPNSLGSFSTYPYPSPGLLPTLRSSHNSEIGATLSLDESIGQPLVRQTSDHSSAPLRPPLPAREIHVSFVEPQAPSTTLPQTHELLPNLPHQQQQQQQQQHQQSPVNGGGGDSEVPLSWLDSLLQGSAEWELATSGAGGPDDSLLHIFDLSQHLLVDDTTQTLSLESPDFGGSIKSLPETMPLTVAAANSSQNVAITRQIQSDKGVSWDHVTHFVSLYLRYLYPLLPFVHRASFAEDLALRRDVRDPDFKALLHSIVAYVISQLPLQRMLSDRFTIDGLKSLQRSCHRVSRSLQRHHYGPTNLTQITTIIFDIFYLLSVGLAHTAGVRLGQAVQLAYSMFLHDDRKTAELGLSEVEIQLRRRVFWQLYVSDKTRAISGAPMIVCDFQGVCSLPEPIDDDYLTHQGYFAQQPKSQPSVLVGFVAVSQVFRILSECLFHHRCILNNYNGAPVKMATAETRLHQILAELPAEIQEPMKNSTGSLRQTYAMQRANILITTAVCKFALYDLRAALDVDEMTLKREKETVAREMHSLLMNIPVDDLASNGESVRGKVSHIVGALCTQVPAADLNYELVRDWYNMFQAISFIQMPVPPPGTLEAESRPQSPPPPEDVANSV